MNPRITTPSTRHGPRRHRWAALATGALLTLVLAAPVSAQGQTTPAPSAQRAAALVRPAIVYLEVYWAAWVKDHNGQFFNDGMPYEWLSSCTGFVVNPAGYIGTAAHCVDDASREGGAGFTALEFAVNDAINLGLYPGVTPEELYAFAVANWAVEGATPQSRPVREIYVAHGIAVSGLRNQRAATARMLDLFPFLEGDAALLKTELAPLPSVELSTGGLPTVGTDILSIGYPGTVGQATDQQLEPSTKDGRISSIATTYGYTVMEMSAPVSEGMSGGPTVDLYGRVVGINSFKPGGETQPFNFATPIDYLKQLMARNGVQNELGQTDQLFREGLDAFYAGRYTDAIAAFDRTLERFPTHQQAQEYRQQAVLARDQQGDVSPTTVSPGTTTAPLISPPVAPATEDDGGSNTLFIVIAVLAGLVAVGAAVMAMRARKRPAGAVPAAMVAAPPAALPPAAAPPPAAAAPMAPAPPAPVAEAPPAAQPAPAAPAATAAPAAGHSLAEEVRELAKLHDEGVLSDEEFAEAKHHLLDHHG